MIIGERAKNVHEKRNPRHTCQRLEDTPTSTKGPKNSGVARQSENSAFTSYNRRKQIWEEFVREVQGFRDCPLKSLVAELVLAIERSGGIWRPGLQTEDEHLWGNDPPYTVPSQECWVDPIDNDDTFGDDVLDNYNKHSINIYRSEQTQSPVQDG